MISEEMFARRLKPAGVPVKYRALRFSHFRPYNTASEQALAAAKAFHDTFSQRRTTDPGTTGLDMVGRGLAFVGAPGAGKTTLATITVTETARTHDVAFVWVAMADYIGRLLDQIAISRQADYGEARALERYWQIDAFKRRVYNSPVVVLDDVGKEHHTASAFAIDEIDKLLRYRFRLALPTVLDTNVPLAKWGDIYNPSMGSFVHEAYEEVLMGGRDLRHA